LETFIIFLFPMCILLYICIMDEKKLEILERASIVYMKFGVKSVTMDDLAKELAISKKTIYKYFKDKHELVREIISMKVSMDSALCINCKQTSSNAIDALIKISHLVIEQLTNINPTVFYDLQKFHPDAWSIMKEHKWTFVHSMIKENIKRGISEGLYRANLNPNIAAKLYVASTDNIMNMSIFPWPEFKFQDVFSEMINIQINGMANDEGRKHLKQYLENEK